MGIGGAFFPAERIAETSVKSFDNGAAAVYNRKKAVKRKRRAHGMRQRGESEG